MGEDWGDAFLAEPGPVCEARSEEVPGFGFLVCELPTAHDGPHREREDGHVWDDAWLGREVSR